MERTKIEKLQEYAQEIAKILYAETNPEEVKTLEGIETTVRQQLLEYVEPEIGNFLSLRQAKQKQEEKERSAAFSEI